MPAADEPRTPKVADQAIDEAVLRLVAERGADKTICPSEVARDLVPGPEWQVLMTRIRRTAVRLALEGRIVITRKGKPVDPTDFRGVYRLGLPRND